MDDGVKERVDQEALIATAARIRASPYLGRSDTLRRLFDFLLERTLAGETPKEIEVASHVFGKPGADLIVDASVRVYVHRLRKKLEDYYAGPGRDDTEQIALPKGEYRLQLIAPEPRPSPPPPAPAVAVPLPIARKWPGKWLFFVGGLLAGGALALAALLLSRPDDGYGRIRSTPPWAALLDSGKPLTFVSGDYYLIGERDAAGEEPKRLVRDFSINSREELDELLMHRAELRDRYVDLGLSYLPVSSAYALKAVLPIVTPSLTERRFTPFVLSSKLTPPMLKNSDVIYAGLLSGLDLLEQPVFAGSRFAFAGSYDEIIDTTTGKIYVADPPSVGQNAQRNYAYVAVLPGPTGNRIIILAGTRDPAVLQAADILTSPDMLAKLAPGAKDGYFEALYAVDGVGSENLRGTLIASNARSLEGMWDALSVP
jgi:hypothetical protein